MSAVRSGVWMAMLPTVTVTVTMTVIVIVIMIVRAGRKHGQ